MSRLWRSHSGWYPRARRRWLLGALLGLAGGALAEWVTRRKTRLLSPEKALLKLGPGAEVLGAFLDGEARAYPLGSFATRSFLSDWLARRRVAVAYDPHIQGAFLLLEPNVGELKGALFLGGA